MNVGMNSETLESIQPGAIAMLNAMSGETETSQALWAQQRPEPDEEEKELEEEHERRKEEEEEDWYD